MATGLNELFTDPRHVRADLRMVERAIVRGWKVEPDAASAILGKLERVLKDSDSMAPSVRNRIQLTVARIVVLANGRNTAAVARAIEAIGQGGLVPSN
jgi:hypothetical protein